MSKKEVLIALQREAQGQLDIFIQNLVDSKTNAEINIKACDDNKKSFENQIEAAELRIVELTQKRAELDEVIVIIENTNFDLEE